MIVSFSMDDIATMLVAAAERYFAKYQHKSGPKTDWGRRQLSIDTIFYGIRAEAAVAYVFDTEIDLGVYPQGKPPPDTVLGDGRIVEVKYGDKRGYDFALRGTTRDHFTGDLGILVWPVVDDWRSVELVGWISKDEFFERGYRTNYLKRPDTERAAIRAKDMNPIETLVAEVGRVAIK